MRLKMTFIMLGLLFGKFCVHGQYLTVDELAYTLMLSNKEKVNFFLDKGFVYSKTSKFPIITLEKSQPVKPQYQQVQISTDENSVVSICSDGGYYLDFMTNYSHKQYEVTKEGDYTMYYDAKKNIQVGLSVTQNTNITYYITGVSVPK